MASAIWKKDCQPGKNELYVSCVTGFFRGDVTWITRSWGAAMMRSAMVRSAVKRYHPCRRSEEIEKGTVKTRRARRRFEGRRRARHGFHSSHAGGVVVYDAHMVEFIAGYDVPKGRLRDQPRSTFAAESSRRPENLHAQSFSSPPCIALEI
jgi:hypothetical protein